MKNKIANRGVTLIEMVIVISILGILGLGLVGLQYILGQNQTLVFKSYLELNDANDVASQFSREFRLARTSDNGAYAIQTANDNEIIFYSDVDFDGQTEKIRYTLSGNEFSRGITEPTANPISYPTNDEVVKSLSDIVRNSTQSAFVYYNEDWPSDTINNPLSSPISTGDIKLVKLYLRINTKNNDPDGDYIIETYAQPRTLKQNL
jgi:prepilin-type N-terminal cleavage/methylation domain-containing protein